MTKPIPGRLFTFGCSFTRYIWPTWADILGQQWEYHENWGKAGSGNYYIFNSIIECLNRHKINHNDMIMILWTSIARTDYYQLGHWYSKINAFSKDPTVALNCPTGYEIVNFPLMHAIHELLEYKDIPFRSMTWNTYDIGSPLSIFYQKTLDKIERVNFKCNEKFIKYFKVETGPWNTFETMYNTMKGGDWPSLDDILQDNYTNSPKNIRDEIDIFKKMLSLENKQDFIEQTEVDIHPLPCEHLRVAQKICPDINIKQTTIDLVDTIEKNILNNQPFSFQPKIPKVRIQI